MVFPSKTQWRNIVVNAIWAHERCAASTVTQDPSLCRFVTVYGVEPHVHPVWVAEQRTKGHRKHFRDLAKLNCVPFVNRIELCAYCNKIVGDQLDHFFHSCGKYTVTREYFWTIVVNSCSTVLGAYLHNFPDEAMSAVILGKRPAINITDREAFCLLEICAKCWQLLAYDKNLKFY